MKKDKRLKFADSAKRHFKELNLDEESAFAMVKNNIRWYAKPDPKDPTVPSIRHKPPVYFLVCRLPPDALNDPLAEVLVGPDGDKPEVFHLYRLTDIWERYWIKNDPNALTILQELRG